MVIWVPGIPGGRGDRDAALFQPAPCGGGDPKLVISQKNSKKPIDKSGLVVFLSKILKHQMESQ